MAKKFYKEVIKRWEKEAPARAMRKKTTTAPKKRQRELYLYAIRKALGKRKEAKIIILGATPELRNLCLNLGFYTLAIDNNFEMIFNLEKNIIKHKSEKNMIIKMDWLKTDFYLKNNFYDLVIGDGVTGQLLFKDLNRFFETIANLLKSGACFITRADVYQPDYPRSTFQNLLNNYRANKISLNEFILGILLYSDVSHLFYDKKKRKRYTYKVFDFLKKMAQKGILTKREGEFFEERRINLIHTFVPVNEFDKIASQYFKKIELPQWEPIWPTYMYKKL